MKNMSFDKWIEEFSDKKIGKDIIEKMIHEMMEWGYLTFHDIVEIVPHDLGTLQESLAIDFNDKQAKLLSGGSHILDWTDVVREGHIRIVFSANTIYAEYVHEGINYVTGMQLKFKKGRSSHYILKAINKNLPDLERRLQKALS